MSKAELDSLLNLIQRPDVSWVPFAYRCSLIRFFLQSHFLKVASLPFHLLISILSKFPVDVDSRVFWEVKISDSLFC